MSARKKALALAAQQQNPAAATSAPAPLMHVAPQDAAPQDAAPAEQPSADQDAAPVAEVEQPSPLTIATDEAPAEQPAPLAEVEQPAAPVALAPYTFEKPVHVPRSMEELLKVVQEAQAITARLTAYRATNEKFGGFTLGREGYTDMLTLQDGSGLKWTTTRSTVIQKVLNVLSEDLSQAIATTEAELRQLLPAA